MGLPDEAFYVPDDVRELYRAAGERGRHDREAWEKRLDAYDGDRAVLDATLAATGLPGWEAALPTWEAGEKVATRVASGKVLQALADVVPALARRRRRPHVQHRNRAQGPRRPVRR